MTERRSSCSEGMQKTKSNAVNFKHNVTATLPFLPVANFISLMHLIFRTCHLFMGFEPYGVGIRMHFGCLLPLSWSSSQNCIWLISKVSVPEFLYLLKEFINLYIVRLYEIKTPWDWWCAVVHLWYPNFCVIAFFNNLAVAQAVIFHHCWIGKFTKNDFVSSSFIQNILIHFCPFSKLYSSNVALTMKASFFHIISTRCCRTYSPWTSERLNPIPLLLTPVKKPDTKARHPRSTTFFMLMHSND